MRRTSGRCSFHGFKQYTFNVNTVRFEYGLDMVSMPNRRKVFSPLVQVVPSPDLVFGAKKTAFCNQFQMMSSPGLVWALSFGRLLRQAGAAYK